MKIVAAAALAASLAVPAWAMCGNTDDIRPALVKQYGGPIAQGVTNEASGTMVSRLKPGNVFEIWADDDGRSVATVSTGDGVTCFFAAVDGFTLLEPIPGGDPA